MKQEMQSTSTRARAEKRAMYRKIRKGSQDIGLGVGILAVTSLVAFFRHRSGREIQAHLLLVVLVGIGLCWKAFQIRQCRLRLEKRDG
jgi:hypothetical protein